MKRNLIIFDIDDTLTKSEFQHQSAYVDAMKEFGITEVSQNWKEYKHYTDSFILRVNYEKNLSTKFDFSFIEKFELKMTEEILKLKPTIEINGARDMMEFVSNNTDYGICFATGSLFKPALIKLNQSNIRYDRDLVIGSNQTFEREGIVQKAIEKAKDYYEVERFETIISFGDGIWDLITAKNLGIHFVGVGMKNNEDFKNRDIKSQIADWTNFDLDKIEYELGIRNTLSSNM